MNRKKLILALLVVALIGAVIYSFVTAPRQQRAGQVKYRPGAPAPSPRKPTHLAKEKSRPEGGDVALLQQEQPRYSGYRRNIFSPIFREEVKLPPVRLPLPPPPKPLPLPLPPKPMAPVKEQPKEPALPPQSREQMELARFTFLGFMSKDGAKTVFLSKDKEIYLVKKGATVAGMFVVTNLTDDALTLTSLSGGNELVIPLVENRALTPRSSKRTP